MKFMIKKFHRIQILFLNKTALYTAVEKQNIDIIKVLLPNDKLDLNILNI